MISSHFIHILFLFCKILMFPKIQLVCCINICLIIFSDILIRLSVTNRLIHTIILCVIVCNDRYIYIHFDNMVGYVENFFSAFYVIKFYYNVCLLIVSYSAYIFLLGVLNKVNQYYNLNEFIESYKNFATNFAEGGRFELNYANTTLFVFPPLTKPISPERLEELAPLRCKGLENVDDSDQYPDMCGICHESYHPNRLNRILPCMHSFHAVCVDEWLLYRSANCPLCRQNLI